jgi:membrane-associated phospholipid phosphatase
LTADLRLYIIQYSCANNTDMTKSLVILLATLLMAIQVEAQLEASAGTWKTWFVPSGKSYRLAAPPSEKSEIDEVILAQQNLDSATWQQILYWNAGSTAYRWREMITKLWMRDTTYNGILANMLLNVATYDATVAAWDSKYTYNRPRPFATDNRISLHGLKPETPSYPCEYSVAAGVASTIIAHFYPSMATSVTRQAQEVMASRIAAGLAFPSDTRAGFDLGKRIAEKEIEHTKGFVPTVRWDRKIPQGPGRWKGKNPMFPLAGRARTVVLDSGSQFRPAPPPDFEKEMEELRNFKPTFRSTANAFYFANQPEDALNKKIFEYNLHLNHPLTARLYAIMAVGMYDGFISCWDAKYTYWGTRPDQYDTTYRPVLFFSPPFPGYPSGHAMIGAVEAELCSYFFPQDRAYFQKRAKDGAESRFEGGIHFRSDNEVGLQMGRKVAHAIIKKIEGDGLEGALKLPVQKPVPNSNKQKTAKQGGN